jgi:hypothetical protein
MSFLECFQASREQKTSLHQSVTSQGFQHENLKFHDATDEYAGSTEGPSNSSDCHVQNELQTDAAQKADRPIPVSKATTKGTVV